MKLFKQITRTLLGAFLLVGLLAGCAKEDDGSESSPDKGTRTTTTTVIPAPVSSELSEVDSQLDQLDSELKGLDKSFKTDEGDVQ